MFQMRLLQKTWKEDTCIRLQTELGSYASKAMEGAIAVQLHKRASKESLHYKNVIGDEDSSSMKQIHDKYDANVSKYSDLSHIKRTLCSKLKALQRSHKSLTGTVRQDFVKKITYVVHQTKINHQ